ncbi:MAG TPA: glycosyltransferase family 2 protein [Bacteroides sp.]|nr:glycosyltransferase family 2 protein [Bacteroides sp.]
MNSVIVPVYNEKDAVSISLDKIRELKLYEKFEFIYIDDGSDDGTHDVISQYPVKLIRHTANKGYGAALKTGIRHATGERVIIMDGDGQHDPSYIEKIDSLLEDYDMVIGERSPGSFQVKKRKAGKKIIRKIGEYLIEQKLPDYNSGYRGFHTSQIRSMLHIMPNGFSFSTTSTLAYLKEGYNISTIPIDVAARIGRKSNVRPVKDGTKTMMLIFRIIMLFNPMKVFLPASISIFLLGFGFGIYGYIVFDRFSNGAMLLTVLGMFLFFIGLLADQIAIMNRKKS